MPKTNITKKLETAMVGGFESLMVLNNIEINELYDYILRQNIWNKIDKSSKSRQEK